jgi:hypothetical protein
MTNFHKDRSVTAELEYIRSDSVLNRRFVAPGAEMNTGRYERRQVRIRDARSSVETLALDRCGFELIKHESTVTDFRDPAALSEHYLPEMAQVVQRMTGADKVIAFSALVRDVDNPTDGAQPAGSDVHTDYTPRRSFHLAQSQLARVGEPNFPFRRFEAINLWRALSPGPQNMPLAVCDALSVVPGEGVPNTMIRVADLPALDEIARPLSDEEQAGEASLFSFRPEHRWYYYPDMRADELLVFRLYDSREIGPWRTPHAAFLDTTLAHPVPRVSVEARTVAYFR